MNKYEKWVNNYIKNIKLENIEWILLDSAGLDDFLEKNYLDKELWEFVCSKNENGLYPTPLGMHYINLYSPTINGQEYSYLLGIVENNIGKKTIISSIIYLDSYFIFCDQKEPITYISTVEVNSFFRNKGIYKKACEILFDFINPNQHVLMSRQSEMGEKCKVRETLGKTAIKRGFRKQILENDYQLSDSELYDILCSKQKLKK